MSGLSSQQEKQVPGTGRGPWGIWSSAHLAQPELPPHTGFVINAPKNLMLAALGPGGTGPLPLPFLVPVPAAFFLIAVEPGRRPAGLRPPEWPWCRAWPAGGGAAQ